MITMVVTTVQFELTNTANDGTEPIVMESVMRSLMMTMVTGSPTLKRMSVAVIRSTLTVSLPILRLTQMVTAYAV